VVVIGLVISAVGILVVLGVWLVDPVPVRRWLGLEKPPPPEPHYTQALQIEQLRADPNVARVLPPDGVPLQWTVIEDRGRLEAQGWRPLCVIDGGEIRRRSYESAAGPRESVLLLKRPQPSEEPAD
jgi:hypothetical protein